MTPSSTRNSNLELYRIICMLMIVAHHYVVNSGLTDIDGPLTANLSSANTLYLRLFGAWGKVGINCFLMITGYYMCTGHITARKWLKLLLQIYFYKIIIYIVLLACGYESFGLMRVVKLVMPIWGLQTNFVTCFLVFYLTIPFWNILIQNMTKKQHEYLLLILLTSFTLFGSLPSFGVNIDYVFWFGIIYLIASYIRLHSLPIFSNVAFWGWMTLLSGVLVSISVLFMHLLFDRAYFFVVDSNKILSVLFGVSSFLWFKNMNISNSLIINKIGGSTFGVLLIHANSNAMRTWLWKDTVDCVGHYSLPLSQLILYSVGVVITIFVICNLIDQLRSKLIEKPIFDWYDKKLTQKVDSIFEK